MYSLDDIGMCSSCHEYTAVLQPCCNASVFFEGDYVLVDNLSPDEVRRSDWNEVFSYSDLRDYYVNVPQDNSQSGDDLYDLEKESR